MIDSIQAISAHLLERSDSVSRSSSPRSKKETQEVSRSIPETVSKPANNKDVVALSFELNGDLETLQKSVSTVFEQIKAQLEKTVGLRREEGDPVKALPSDKASAEEIVAFYSPENTAKRIADFATSFFSAYAESRPKASKDQNAEDFTTLITKAVQDGFDRAELVLGDFSKLGEIGDNIKKTYDLVLQEIAHFREKFIAGNSSNPKEPKDAAKTDSTTTEVSQDQAVDPNPAALPQSQDVLG